MEVVVDSSPFSGCVALLLCPWSLGENREGEGVVESSEFCYEIVSCSVTWKFVVRKTVLYLEL